MNNLDQFRADFALVWKDWMAQNHETTERYASASRAVKENMHDAAWMAGARNHFAFLAGRIRRDRERSERIKLEVRAERARRVA